VPFVDIIGGGKKYENTGSVSSFMHRVIYRVLRLPLLMTLDRTEQAENQSQDC
jgi:hypothetical protein